MARFVVVSDLHLNLYSKYSKPNLDVNSRFHHQRVILRQIFQMATQAKANVVFDGDIFDSRGSIDCRVMNLGFHEINNGAQRLNSNTHQQTYLLAGNHDQVDNSTRPANSISIFKGQPNLHVIDKPSLINIGNDDAAFLPYSEDKKWLMNNLHAIMRECNPYGDNLLFGHLGVAGAKMGAHLVRLSGEFSLNDLAPKFFDYIILGHYHHRQFLNKAHTAFYVGNPIPLRHEDDGQVKGVWYLDTENKVSRFVPLKSPMFYTFHVKKGQHSSKVGRLAKDNFVRVVSSDKPTLDYYRHKYGIVDTVLKNFHAYKPRLNIKPSNSSKDVVKAYCKKYAPKVTKVALKELGKAEDEMSSN